MQKIPLYSRDDYFKFNPDNKIDHMEYTLPDGTTIIAPVFKDYLYDSQYDDYGYYHVNPKGIYGIRSRFSPFMEGLHKWRALNGTECIFSGEFMAVASNGNSGFVRVGPDKRYFCLDNDRPFVPIGINIASDQSPDSDRLGEPVSLGLKLFFKRIRQFAQNGGNVIRISLSDPFFNIRTESFYKPKNEALYNLDNVIEFCRQEDIKVIVTLDSFKTFKDDFNFADTECRRVREPLTARRITDLDAFLTDSRLVKHWFNEVCNYLFRLWGDPVIMAFELWDEIDLMDAKKSNIEAFSNKILKMIKNMSPNNLVTTSFGAFYSDSNELIYKEAIQNDNIQFLPVHRFLNRNAALSECAFSAVQMAATAVEKLRNKTKPLLLSQTGALDNLKGTPFRFYSNDYAGTILNDCAFVPFFTGAAGVGMMCHVKEYIEPHNLYRNYKPFADMLHNIKVHNQHFKPETLNKKNAYVFVLKGRSATLIYVRSKNDDWKDVVPDGCDLPLIKGISLPSYSGKKAKIYPLFGDKLKSCEIDVNGKKNFTLPPFKYGCFIKIR